MKRNKRSLWYGAEAVSDMETVGGEKLLVHYLGRKLKSKGEN